MNKPTRPVISLKTAQATPPTIPEPPQQETVVPQRLCAPFGFVNEYDAVYFKSEDAIITNPVEIAILRERGAQLEDA